MLLKKILIVVLFLIAAQHIKAASFIPKSFKATLEEAKKNLGLRKKKVTTSSLMYKYPKRLYLKREGSLYVCNAKKVWYYNPPFSSKEKGELKIGTSSKYCFSKLFDTLANGLKTNKLYSVKGKGKKALISFSKKFQKSLSITKIDIIFNKSFSVKNDLNDVEKMLIYNLGNPKPREIKIKNIDLKTKIPNSLFHFKIPKNTNVTKM